MAVVVRMPKLGLSMVEGVVSEWLVSDGEFVAEGDLLVGIETAKISYQVEASASGTIRKIYARNTDVVPVGGALCVIAAADEELDFDLLGANNAVPGAALPAGFDPSTTRLGVSDAFGPSNAVTDASASGATSPSADHGLETNPADHSRRIKASPVARKLAEAYQLDLSGIEGSGPTGRIEKKDVEKARLLHVSGSPMVEVAPLAHSGTLISPPPAAGVGPTPRDEPRIETTLVRRALTRAPLAGTMRRVISENMRRSKQTAAHATMSLAADVSELIALRDGLNSEGHSLRITFTDLFVKAVGRALIDNAMMRTVIDGDDLVTFNDIDISIAVHLGESGLIVPVLRDCDRLSLRAITAERIRLIELGRAGRLGPDDMAGGCFTITNMGAVYDLDFGTPIINLPQSAILGFGSIQKQAVVVDDDITMRPMINLFLSIDHRVIDGEPAVRFLNQVCDILSRPSRGFALH
jgi:pyruvate dehydrogenase E2 component (dihydrolipoamide acetyltransferase)